MVDVTNGDSYFQADNWLADVDRYAGRRTRRVMMVATKCDMVAKRIVDTEALVDVRLRSRQPFSISSAAVVEEAPHRLL